MRAKLTSSMIKLLPSMTLQCFATGIPLRRFSAPPKSKAVPCTARMVPKSITVSTVDFFHPRRMLRWTRTSGGGSTTSEYTRSQVVVGLNPNASGSGRRLRRMMSYSRPAFL